jgi:hypothetical protein
MRRGVASDIEEVVVVTTAMRSIVIQNNLLRQAAAEASLIRERKRWAIGMSASAATAALTGLFGIVIAAFSLLHVIDPYGGLSLVGNLFLVVTFALMIVAAHCLDKMDETTAKIRAANERPDV